MINSRVKEAENAVVDVRSRASRRGGNFKEDIGEVGKAKDFIYPSAVILNEVAGG
jgi:hypothetical protein